MFELQFILAGVATVASYLSVRRFVRNRLRFVDAVHKRSTPMITGVAVAAVALPLAILPVITWPMAVLAGVGTAAGVKAGRRDINRRLNP